jgi:hypothetical protein
MQYCSSYLAIVAETGTDFGFHHFIPSFLPIDLPSAQSGLISSWDLERHTALLGSDMLLGENITL